MKQLRLAERCGRLNDVEGWLDEIDADAYAELEAFDELQPAGWEAIRIATRRLSYIVAVSGGAKKLGERHFDIVIGGALKSDAEKSARWEAFAIRAEFEQQARGGKEHGRQSD